MKKSLKKGFIISLATAFIFSLAGTSFAAENPFATVPSTHWAYPSIVKLVHDGLIDGYADGDFRGDKPATRYEMAVLTAKAMFNLQKADAKDKEALDKLQQEFSVELTSLGVRVDKLEKKVDGLGKLKIGGELRFRYDYAGSGVPGFTGAKSDKQKNGQVRYRLNMTESLDGNWKMVARYESSAAKFGGSGSDNANNLVRAWLEGDLAGMHVLAGRGNFKTFNAYTGWDKDNWDGAGVTIGNKVTLDMYAMKYGGTNTTATYGTGTEVDSFSQKNTWFKLAQLKYSFSPTFTMATQWLKNPIADRGITGKSYDTIGIGFKYSGIDNITLGAEYAENRATRVMGIKNGALSSKVATTNKKPKGYEIKLDYRDADKSKVGTWGTWVGYRYAEDGFDRGDMTTGFRHDNASGTRMNNIKGFEIGLDYIFIKNTKFEAFYIDGKTVNGNDIAGTDNKRMAYAQMELFF